jgi:hypothetical protein
MSAPKAKPTQKHPQKSAGGRKGGKMRQARNREAIKVARMKVVLERKLEGASFEEIGRELRLSAEMARRMYHEHMDALKAENANLGERVRTLELLRMERTAGRAFKFFMSATLSVRSTTEEGDVMEVRDFEVLKALGPMITQMSARRAALAGADAPKQLELTGNKPLTEAELVARLRAAGVDPETV